MDIRKTAVPTAGMDVATIHAAIELSMKSWLLGLRSPLRERMSRHGLEAADARGLWRVIARERQALLAAGYRTVRVVTCYEAGRDGFWLHRFLLGQGAESRVVDPGSVLVNRRAKRAKTDRLDLEGLLRLVMRHDAGDSYLGRMVVVPSVAEEDRRRPERERRRLLSERTAHNNRMKSLAVLHGAYGLRPLRADRRAQLAALRGADGQPLPALVMRELERELARLELVRERLRKAGATDRVAAIVRQLLRLRSVGLETASVLAHEVFWRSFSNRRAVARYVGLDPSPFQSGAIDHEQGIAKAGNRRARTAMIELAWDWTRLQPDSALTHWFKAAWAVRRTGPQRRKLIVALARRLLVALWRYVTTGLVPTGAALKPAAAIKD
jgi:transposase